MSLKKISSYQDILIIGGGIVGSGILRDLALNQEKNETQLKVLLVDKGDFNSQTSQGSSKMLHGGIRYLENLDFSLVMEALQEKNLWLQIAPHLCYKRSFHLPIYRSSKYPLWMLKMGLLTYDILSFFKNTPHQVLNKQKTQLKLPSLNPQGLKGSGVYSDAIVDDAKLGLECLYDALIAPHIHALNYTEVISFKKGVKLNRVTLKDNLTGEIKEIQAKEVVFATGPFTDKVMKDLNISWLPKLKPSKGIHLWFKQEALSLEYPVVLQTKDARIIFVIPQRGAILAGTTESPVTEEMYNIKANQSEIDYLISCIRDYFPHANLSQENIISSFAAVRPLVFEGNMELGRISRVHKLYHPSSNIHVILGGKYTTFRIMAQDMVKILMNKFNLPYDKTLTMKSLRKPSLINTFEEQDISPEKLSRVIQTEKVRTFEDLWKRRLGHFTPDRVKEMKNHFDSSFKA